MTFHVIVLGYFSQEIQEAKIIFYFPSFIKTLYFHLKFLLKVYNGKICTAPLILHHLVYMSLHKTPSLTYHLWWKSSF